MTTNGPSVEHLARAKALRRASVLIATHAEPGRTRAEVLEKLALLIGDLEGTDARECRWCNEPFVVGHDETKFYRSKGLEMPTHCKRCRSLRRQQQANERRAQTAERGPR